MVSSSGKGILTVIRGTESRLLLLVQRSWEWEEKGDRDTMSLWSLSRFLHNFSHKGTIAVVPVPTISESSVGFWKTGAVKHDRNLALHFERRCFGSAICVESEGPSHVVFNADSVLLRCRLLLSASCSA